MTTMHTHNPTGAAARQVVQRMGEAAVNFLAALSTDQRAKAQIDFADENARTEWHYTPTERRGLPFTEMDRSQQRLSQALVGTGLSTAGYVTASTIMGIETWLDYKEGYARPLWWRDSRVPDRRYSQQYCEPLIPAVPRSYFGRRRLEDFA